MEYLFNFSPEKIGAHFMASRHETLLGSIAGNSVPAEFNEKMVSKRELKGVLVVVVANYFPALKFNKATAPSNLGKSLGSLPSKSFFTSHKCRLGDELAIKVKPFAPVSLTFFTAFLALIFPNGDTLYGVIFPYLDDC